MWAACGGSDPDRWFVEVQGRQSVAELGAALGVCRSCPVQAECLDAAMVFEGMRGPTQRRFGVWGGLTPAQRARLAAEAS